MKVHATRSIGLDLRVGCLGLLVCLASSGVPVHAEPLEVQLAYTLIGQASDEDALQESTTGSVDLFFAWERGESRIDAYIEGNSSLKDRGIATRLPRSNADAGTALDTDSGGRAQLSELKYTHSRPGTRSLSIGLLDPSGYLDSTRINNDENQQFLGASFVNNPTIAFPDYTLGVAAKLSPVDARQRWNLVVAGSNGIADNPNLSYSQLLNVTGGEKGVFAAAEVAWPLERLLVRTGIWWNTADHETLDGSRSTADNYGWYSAIGASKGRWAANLRLGAANPEVSLAQGFASVSAQRGGERRTIGLALSRTWISADSTADVPSYAMHLETYLRFQLTPNLGLTPSVQYLVHGGFDASGPALDKNVVVYSLRLHHVFFQRG